MANAVIASGGNLSAAVSLGTVLPTHEIVGFQMPSAWDTANLTFQSSQDATTYNDVYDSDGNEVTVSAAASRFIVLTDTERAMLSRLTHLRIRSGTAGTPVTQNAERTIRIMTK